MISASQRVVVLADRERERPLAEVDRGHVAEDELRAEALRLLAEQLHQLRAHARLGEAGIVLHVGGDRELPAGLRPLDDQRRQVGARGVERGGEAGGAGADDDEFVMRHSGSRLIVTASRVSARQTRQRAAVARRRAGPRAHGRRGRQGGHRARGRGARRRAHAAATLRLIRGGKIAKGEVLAVARVAGIMAAKRTADLIPLCHPLPIEVAAIDFTVARRPAACEIEATRQGDRQDRRRDGGADRRQRRGADGLRHVQGRRSRHGDQRHPPDGEARRPQRRVPKRNDSKAYADERSRRVLE